MDTIDKGGGDDAVTEVLERSEKLQSELPTSNCKRRVSDPFKLSAITIFITIVTSHNLIQLDIFDARTDSVLSSTFSPRRSLALQCAACSVLAANTPHFTMILQLSWL